MQPTFVKPYHLFKDKNGWCLINIEGMSVHPINEAMAGVLDDEAVYQGRSLAPHVEETLIKLDLLSYHTPSPHKTAAAKAIPIVNMSLFLTQLCNLRCVYCYGDHGEYGAKGNMEEETAFQAVDWMIEQSGEIKKLHINFFGGEPFLNFPLMKSVVEYAEKKAAQKGKKAAFHATSNGTVLDDDKITFVKKHDINVMISFDGPKEIQDAQRPYVNGQGSYESILPGLKKLLAVLPRTRGHSVIVGNTDRKLVKKAMQEIGFVRISIVPASPSLFGKGLDDKMPARDIGQTLDDLEGEAAEWIEYCKNRDKDALYNLKAGSGLIRAIIALLHNRKRRYGCGAGRGLAAVSCSGDVYLCHRFVGQEQFKLGTIFSRELRREAYQKSPTTGSGICTTCFARYYCAGGCKHENVGSCGSIHTPPKNTCSIRRRELELAASIICSLNDEDRAFLIEQDIFPPKPCPFDF